MSAAGALLQVLVFPGLLFAAAAGLVASWVDRKLTARLQKRVGPPFLQPLYDVGKLMIKETCVPEGASLPLFLGAPLLGLAGAALASVIVWRALLSPEEAFVGDLIVVLSLLTLPPLSIALGAFAARNPLASLGGSREIKMMLAYELPLVLAACVPIVSAGSLRLGDIVLAPAAVAVPSGLLALAVAVPCMQAMLGQVPFDLPEAETELTGGALIEYSGPPLALYRITRAMMLFLVPCFLIALFLVPASGWPLAALLAYVPLLVIVILVRNTAPRVRIDQALGFFWGPVTAAAVGAVALAALGW
ncbi:MAG: NADH-quinone oxidoreductase subunit H [Myxococcota bacterium]|nr:NADH-quinone oxidoreductase subunit H [Myxococcota bacterium]